MTLILGIGVLITCELFFRLPFYKELRMITKCVRLTAVVARSKYSNDERKERLLLACSIVLGRSSLILLSYLMIVVLPVFVFAFIEFRRLEVMTQNLTSVSFILYSIVLATVYAIGRRYVSYGKLFKS